jgi:hypothetical protein
MQKRAARFVAIALLGFALTAHPANAVTVPVEVTPAVPMAGMLQTLVTNFKDGTENLYDTLIVCGFAFAPEIDESRLNFGSLKVLKTRMNQDLRMGNKLKGNHPA